MQVNWAEDSGDAPGETQYALRWETLEENRDRARADDPPATTLTLYAFDRQ